MKITDLEEDKRQLNEHLVNVEKQAVLVSEGYNQKLVQMENQMREQQTRIDHLESINDQLT